MLVTAGGALAAQGVTFRDCAAVGDGGCVLAVDGSSAELVGSSLLNCSSSGAWGGGALALFGSRLSLQRCAVAGCASRGGAAFGAAYASSASASATSVASCAADGYGGGAVAFYNSSLQLLGGCSVTNTSSTTGGLALFTWRGSRRAV